jgi:hypothetical protein
VVTVVIGATALAFVGLVVWFLKSRWAAERDWVYNKHNPRPRGLGTLGLIETIYQPSLEHVIEEKASERARGSQDESGDKPVGGRPA